MKPDNIFRVTCAWLALSAPSASAAALPGYFIPPPKAFVIEETLVDEDFGEASFPIDSDERNLKQGRHYHADLRLPGVDDSTHEALWAPFRTALSGAGWSVARYADANPPSATLRYQRGGVDAWAVITMFAADDIRMDLVEVKAFTPTVTLSPPAAKPETIGAHEPFPYLAPPGMALTGTSTDDAALYVKLKGDEEPTLISPRSVMKNHARPERMSTLQFVLEYRNALAKAGWEIVEQVQGYTSSDAVLSAHYAKNGRDIWASMHLAAELTIAVADISGDLAATLAKECHLPLYGITFEFNRATLRPESESTLQRVATALTGAPALSVEIQGHTDNVGADDYNLKLSQARADAVRSWLGSHGIAAGRMTARGYGRSQPVADNGTAEGRARNRRVELAMAACK